MAAKLLGMESVPAIYVEGLTDAQRRAYILADNRLTELGGWDEFLVQQELAALKDEGFNIELTGFELDIDDELVALEEEENVNPTDCLPDSNCYIFSVSAFGTQSEKILMLKMEQELAERVLSAIESNGDEVLSKLREALNEL
jgi:ParB-like chromosome segregation protein Spo0J